MKVQKIQIAQCALPLPRPIRLGPVEIKTREFIAVRLTGADGTVGEALSYPRGAPLFELTKALAPRVLGTRSAFRRETLDGAMQALVNNRMMLTKAASLFDIALWDMSCRQYDLPLYKLMGAYRQTVPVMVVAGYYLDQRSTADIEREVADLCGEGFTRIKVMISGADAQFDLNLVKALHKIAGDRMSVDAHWAYRTVPQAILGLRRIDDLGLRFIEDPFGPHQAQLYRALKTQFRTPLASGEDFVDENALGESLNDLSILRLDATTCGGVTAANNLLGAAKVRGTAVLPHVFMPIHAQLAGSHDCIEAVELIPIEVGACPMWDLLEGGFDIRNGQLEIDQRPGSGFHLNWAKVTENAVFSFESSL